MKFSDITAAVHDAWQFSWPPVVACLVAYYIVAFLYPAGLRAAIGRVRSVLSASRGSVSDLREAIQPFGLTTLIPFVALVFVIAFLYLMNMAAMGWSSELPPYLSYRPDRLLWDRMGEKEKVLLFRKYPTAERFDRAYYMGFEEHRAKGSRDSGPSRAENYYKLQNFTKFAAAVALLTVVVAARRRELSVRLLGKASLLLVAAAAIWTVGLVGLLYQQEQQFVQDWTAVRSDLQTDASKLLEKEITAEEKARIRESASGPWWQLYAFDPYRVDWIKRTFFEKQRAPEP